MNYIRLFLISILSSGINAQTDVLPMKTVEVSGHAEMVLDPDEIIFTINIEEYWEEEFEGKKWEDYKTKVDITKIETELIAELNKIGVGLEQITLKSTGNYWRQRGKDFLVNKNLDISISSFKIANEITNRVQTRGIKSMFVSDLRNKDLDSYVLEVQAEAVHMATRKAENLAAAAGGRLGKAVRIVEIDGNQGIIQRDQMMMRSMASAEGGINSVQYENYRKIKVAADVRIVFGLE